MPLAFEAHVKFEVPDGTNARELAEILDYVKEAVDKWRYARPKGRGAEGQGPWKMSAIDVPSFSDLSANAVVAASVEATVASEVDRHLRLVAEALGPATHACSVCGHRATPWCPLHPFAAKVPLSSCWRTSPNYVSEVPVSSAPKKKVRVIVQKWEESERGWGTRPDGYSIHPDEDALFRYIEAYRAKLPEEIPDEYERPCGTPYLAEVELDAGEDIGDGKRFYKYIDSGYPVSLTVDGGKDGWVAVPR